MEGQEITLEGLALGIFEARYKEGFEGAPTSSMSYSNVDSDDDGSGSLTSALTTVTSVRVTGG